MKAPTAPLALAALLLGGLPPAAATGRRDGRSRAASSRRRDTTPQLLPVAPADGAAYVMTQATYCLDFDVHASKLGLYDCKSGDNTNQMFVWRSPHPGSDYHQIFSPAGGGRCLTVDAPRNVRNGTRPADGASLAFAPCDPTDDYAKWCYAFREQTMFMARWPDLCFDFNEWSRTFGAYPCLKKDMGLIGGVASVFGRPVDRTKNNQVVFMELSPRRFGVPAQMPTDGALHLMTQGGYCLDYHVQASNLILHDCDYQANQAFIWKPTAGNSHQIAVPVADGRCLTVDPSGQQMGEKPSHGTKVDFSDCASADDYEKWSYNPEKAQLALSKWPDLCADYKEASDNFGVYPCTEEEGNTKYNQVIKFEPLPYRSALTDAQLKIREAQAPELLVPADEYEFPSSTLAAPAAKLLANAPIIGGCAYLLAAVAVLACLVRRRRRRWAATGLVEYDSFPVD